MRLRRKPEAKELLFAHPLVETPTKIKLGTWRQRFSTQTAPLYIEIGTGKGQFLAKASRQFPEINWIGIERIEEPLLQAVQKGEEYKTTNLRYLWGDANLLNELFAPNEIDQIYLHFSDPWPKKRHAKRRLTHRSFLSRYQEVLSPQGHIILKTDSESLYQFSLEEFKEMGWTIQQQSWDLHQSEYASANITTEYEDKFVAKGMPIFYVKVSSPTTLQS